MSAQQKRFQHNKLQIKIKELEELVDALRTELKTKTDDTSGLQEEYSKMLEKLKEADLQDTKNTEILDTLTNTNRELILELYSLRNKLEELSVKTEEEAPQEEVVNYQELYSNMKRKYHEKTDSYDKLLLEHSDTVANLEEAVDEISMLRSVVQSKNEEIKLVSLEIVKVKDELRQVRKELFEKTSEEIFASTPVSGVPAPLQKKVVIQKHTRSLLKKGIL